MFTEKKTVVQFLWEICYIKYFFSSVLQKETFKIQPSLKLFHATINVAKYQSSRCVFATKKQFYSFGTEPVFVNVIQKHRTCFLSLLGDELIVATKLHVAIVKIVHFKYEYPDAGHWHPEAGREEEDGTLKLRCQSADNGTLSFCLLSRRFKVSIMYSGKTRFRV